MAILVKPLITEKMSLLSESKGQYGFRVALEAKKPEIKAEIERMYNVEVDKIRTLVVAGKRKSRFTKSGVSNGKSSNYKKAIVSLKDGKSIDFYENI
ncbi:MAG: 50S ribosomal protein L23 [Bacteroidia bacterium]|jgi:large subunit ribosomal protein L23|uniref:Large ribosomal subunit protein uL23 n=1 Tax=uncultured Sphingobacteriia bacterium TaxID=246143 RepID=F4MME0_9BACT|nr:LSU ribosomal protein L23p (L23Ae) [uncultured bacterium]MDB9791159.1 50S ribosomal protein L23 [Bacteroidia bacterium]CBL87303.1 ribosomal protein L23 [uncultured Sphingobacteriia bacterium]|tara:strand:- start:3478 stop:3768 length:291 start_codon:yes stop_codon:yes gene_type:complete